MAAHTLKAGQWAGDRVWVVGSGPSRERVDLQEIDALAAQGVHRVITVNHAWHDFDHADVAFGKDVSLWRPKLMGGPGFPTCCSDRAQANPSAICVFCMCDRTQGLAKWRERYPELLVLREWPRSGPGQCGPWPSTIDDSDEGALVTCGNSGIGALCLADMLLMGDGEIHITGLDFDREPYALWARWFQASGYALALRSRVVVHGDTALDPLRHWDRAPQEVTA